MQLSLIRKCGRNTKYALGMIAVFMTTLFGITDNAIACGADSDCVIGNRTYRIRMPADHDGTKKIGAIVYMHGWRGSAAAVMNNKSLGKSISDMGLALIAAKSFGEGWAIPGTPSKAEPVELEYFDALIRDVATKFPIDTSRLMASGFSGGGMMVWNLACERGEMFAGFAPISGTFWEPIPESCSSSPVSLVHTHGTSDTMVPITGRAILDTRQGSVPNVLAMYSRTGGYTHPRTYKENNLDCRELTNENGKILEICLHPKGHVFRKEYVVRAWNKFVESGDIPPG